MDSFPSSRGSDGETRVDLGEDLLEPTRVVEPSKSGSSEDELQSARILMGEGLWDQAKQALHQALRYNPENKTAKMLLEEIQQRELETLLARPSPAATPETSEEDIELILKKLDDDWNLGLLEDVSPRLTLVSTDEARRELVAAVERQAVGMTPRDRTDLAVAFLQMDMPEPAVSLLAPLASRMDAGAALYCRALLQAERAFDCAELLESRLRSEDVSGDLRTEMEYLLARARERLGEQKAALELYSALGGYRDSQHRKERLLRARGGSP